MENLVLFVHLITAVAIIVLILLQRGKGAEMGASFGAGASQTLFGASGSGNFFSKMTAVAATVFFVTSFSLAVIAKQSTQMDEFDLPELEVDDSGIPTTGLSEGESEIPSFNPDQVQSETEAALKSAIDDALAKQAQQGALDSAASESDLPEAVDAGENTNEGDEPSAPAQ